MVTKVIKPVAAKKVAPKVNPPKAAAPVKKVAKSAPAPAVKSEAKVDVAAPKKRPTPVSFLREFTPSKALGAVVGVKALTRSQATKGIWDFIKKHKLQNPANKRMIVPNAALKAVFGKTEVNMLEIAGLLNKHLTAA